MTLEQECCDPAGPAQAGIRPALARRARAIEAALPGDRATELEWRILLGLEAGALSWAMTQRLFHALDLAAQQPGSRLDCR